MNKNKIVGALLLASILLVSVSLSGCVVSDIAESIFCALCSAGGDLSKVASLSDVSSDVKLV
ncbi:unnamed protein product, partial [marine sediment metagenome]